MQPTEYLSFEDPEQGRTWMFDLGFLLSTWTCIYGAGCKGVLQHDASALQHGCCTHGAHFVTEGDMHKVERAVQRLEPRQWQFAAVAQELGWSDPTASSGLAHTRLHDGACIFLNRPGFAGGMGCALHNAAKEAGERPMDWKPLVCWQLPLRVTETADSKGHLTTTLRAWKRRDWGRRTRQRRRRLPLVVHQRSRSARGLCWRRTCLRDPQARDRRNDRRANV